MAGHSHWANIAHKKGVIDAKRGKLWSKLAKAIIIAAKAGGGDPDANLKLRYAIIDAKAGNMPKDTIDRAVKKGTGELEGVNYEEILYEGYGPGGVAVLCDILTDNRNRTAPEVRKLFEIAGGKLGGAGSVAWMFDRKGLIYLDGGRYPEDKALEDALEAGAEDFAPDGGQYEITTSVAGFHAVQDALKARRYAFESAELAMVPKNTVKVEGSDANRLLKLMEALEELDDVSKVSSNFDIDAATLAEAEA
jgi:YebC/PmpR family DNA-binding regulatory protein